jgi:hypothetical protein
MCTAGGYRDTDIASFAVHVISTQTFTTATDTTVVAVVYAFCAVIVPELAFWTVVVGRIDTTVYTCRTGRLRGTAQHA